MSRHQRHALPPAVVLAFVVLLQDVVVRVSAQITSNATCLSNWRDLYNSKGQSPCLVGAYLGGACNGGQYDVGALEDGQHYIGPTSFIADPCLCSTVMYSVMGACSICQNATIIAWSSWSSNCATVYVSTFPDDIPADTAVPGWAYENITTTGNFDVNQALADSSPESTATFVQQTNSGSKTSGSATSTASSGVSGQGSNGNGNGNGDSNKKKTNTGAIAGGVVGGVVGLALIALLGFFLIRRRRNSKNKKNGYVNGTSGTSTDGIGSSSLYNNGGMVHRDEYAPVPFTPNVFDGTQQQQQKLYDPNDPSTFPTSPSPALPPPGSLHNQTTGHSYAPSFPQPRTQIPMHSGGTMTTGDSNPGTGMYRGVAEV